MTLQCGSNARHLRNMLEKALNKEQEVWAPKIYSDKCNESEITPDNRDQLVKWLAHLTRKFKFLPETFGLAVDILDRLLQAVKARFKHLKVIGVTCIYLAAKTLQEDETIPATLELVRESQCGCSVAEVHRMELIILGKLGWDLRSSSAVEFTQLFQALLLSNSPHLLHGLVQMTAARQLALLTDKLLICLAYHGFMAFRPSTLALALLSLELEMFRKDWFVYTVGLERVLKGDTDSLMICREKLASYLSSVQYTKSLYIYTSRHSKIRTPTTNSSIKAAKRKVKEMEDDDVYDAIKRLYNDEEPTVVGSTATAAAQGTNVMTLSNSNNMMTSTTCAGEMQLERSKSLSAHQTVAVK